MVEGEPHLGDQPAVVPSTSELLTRWSWDPSIIIGILAVSAAYFYAVGPLRRKRDLRPPVSRGQVCFFISAQLLLALALLSPLDDIGDEYLFSAHMVQHVVLAAVWPPLVLLSLPPWLVRPVFTGPFRSLAEFFTLPVIALIAFNIDIYFWHIPPFYDATLTNEQIHIVEHLSFMAFGLLVWWPILSPIARQRLSYPIQVLYLFAAGMFMMALGIVFTFAPVAFYQPYVDAPRLWGFSPVSDQQLGGLIMWYPGNVPYGIALVVAFYRWFDGSDDVVEVELPQSSTIGPPLPNGRAAPD